MEVGGRGGPAGAEDGGSRADLTTGFRVRGHSRLGDKERIYDELFASRLIENIIIYVNFDKVPL